VAQKIWTTFIKERWGAKYSDRKAAGKGAQAPYVAAQVSNATHGTSGYQPRALMVPGPGVFPTGRSGTVPVKLWPNETASRMRVTFPTASGPGTRWAVVIFRGGAYSTPRGSGGDAARWASKRGFVAAEVDYGTAMIGAAGAFPHNVWDGQRAVRLVRANARAWGVQPNRIVLMGFSAGAHLAAVVSVGKNIPQTPEADDLAHVCARPNAVVLAYGVLSFVDGYRPGAYLSTVDNFFGGSKKHDQALRDKFSPDLTVGRDCPPAFVWTLRRDSIVPYTHSTRFAAAAKKAGVTVELRVYEQGGHGVGMAEGSGLDCEKWPKEWLEWMATLE
jgi:acetyl esterase/lipase